MCGIAGLWNRETAAPVSRALLSRMVAALHHRGPDDRGVYHAGDLGLGHTRLSIVDLAGGHQPMGHADGRLQIVFNGEIYNHVELREALVKKGHRFRTTSDTEVILHLYQEEGEACVTAFNGQFAFALWDADRRRLFLARDRMGVRPLFYATVGGRFRFASEVKALFEDPTLPKEIDPIAIDQTFTFWFPIPPRTGFVGVSELAPGHTMTVSDAGIQTVRYWQMTFPPAAEAAAPPHPEAWYTERLIDLLDDAVRIRLRADVEVGAYLSGGLDSSVITALARRRVNNRLQTFSIGFEAAAFDETEHQNRMVAHLGVSHHHVRCSNAQIAATLPSAIRQIERPILRTAPVPMMPLAAQVQATGMKVVLTGEGADEVLAGYDIFKEEKVRRFWARSPQSAWRPMLLRRLYPYLPQVQQQSAAYLAGFFGLGLTETDDPFYSHRPRWRVTTPIKALYSEEMRDRLSGEDAVAALRDLLPAGYTGWHPLSRAQYLEAALLLPQYILSSQGDRPAMAHAVEARHPFLDHRLVEFAATIPPQFKLKGLREKHLLREATRHLLPSSIVNRVKQPYRAPDAAALAAAPSEEIEAALAPDAVSEAGLFSPSAVSALWTKCKRQTETSAKDGMAIMGVLSTQLLHRQFVKSTDHVGDRS